MSMKIRNRIVYFLIIFTLATITAASIASAVQVRMTLRKNTVSNFYRIAEEVYYNVNRVIIKGMDDIKVITTNPIISALHAAPYQKKEELSRLKTILRIYDTITLVRENGTVIAATENVSPPSWIDGINIHSALRGEVTLSSVNLDTETEELYVAFAAPVKVPGRRTDSVILTRLNMKHIAEIVNHVKIGETGRAVLLDRHFRIIAYSDKRFLLKILTGTIVDDINNDEEILSYNNGDRQMLGSYFTKSKALKSEVDQPYYVDWRVVISQEGSDINRALRNIIWQIIVFSILLCGIALYAGIRFSRRFTDPILKLREGVLEISRGNLDYRLDVYAEDEIGELSVLFNRMAVEIQNYQDTIQKNEHRLRTILNTANEGYVEVDRDFNIRDVNPEMCRFLGYMKDDIIGKNIFHFLANNESKKILTRQRVFRMRGMKNSYEIDIRNSDGETIHGLFNASPLYNEREEHIGSFAMVSDISEIKKAEEEVRYTRNYLNNVFNSLPSMLISINNEGQITQWNTAAENQLGIPADDAISKNIREIAPFLRNYIENFNRVLVNNAPEEYSKESFVTPEETKFMNISIYPLIFNGTRGAVIRVDDITEVEKKEEQLRQAQKMELVGNLAGGLAHDFNNVLSGITGTVSLIKLAFKSDTIDIDQLKKDIETIEQSAVRATNLVQRLMGLSRKHDLTMVPMDLRESIESVVQICANTLDKRVEIVTDYQAEDAMIEGDQVQIEQVFLNLCVNASHAMTIMRGENDPPGGRLTITISAVYGDDDFRYTHPKAVRGYYWLARVEDTGVGMDSKTLSRIFDPFFTTKKEDLGTGLGLAMVYNIIQQHRGFIDVYSEPGRGTSFNVYLPLKEASLSLFREETCDERLLKGTGTILLVDDEELLRKTARRILENCGYSVLVARDGFEAIDIYMENMDRISLVLLDMAMPKLSGREVFLELRKINPAVKVILASGLLDSEHIGEVMALGFSGYIQKPFTMTDLAMKIKEVN